jgi:branched-chain amino acid transport system substrate-binding protein
VRCHCSRSLVTAAFTLFLAGCSSHGSSDRTLTIAAVGPLTGAQSSRGRDLVQAARMAVEEANAAGGVQGSQITLATYDDGDQPERARSLAAQIADGPALAVLGQVASSAGYAAGQVYQARAIPAITGAASESRVTAHNDYFFRLFRSAAGQGSFLADYARYRFQTREIAVIRETGTAGEEFAAAFRDRAKASHIRIAEDLAITPTEAGDPAALGKIMAKLAHLPKGDIVVLGTQFAEAPVVLHALRDKLGPVVAMGYSSLASDALPAQLASSERERQALPGYYTDGFIVAAPQLGDVAQYAQTVFASRYKVRYGADPTPEAVRWYEGARLIFQAIAAKNISGTDRQSDRRRIRDWLAGLNSPQTAANDVAGPIYFDSDHNAQRGIAAGVFFEGRLISAPVQFTAVQNPEQVPEWDKLVSNGMVVDAGGASFVKTPVVYAGIEMNQIDNIDVRVNTFAADFFLWFRTPNDQFVDPHDVEFPTVVSGATLGKEVGRKSYGGFTTITYHVKGVFRSDYEFSRFPFDQQVLRIPVQIHNENSYTMILAYAHGSEPATPPDSVVTSKLWKLKEEIFYRDVVAYKSSFGESSSAAGGSIEVNRINAAVTVKRDVLGFAIKNFLPLVCILVAVLVGYAIAPDVINPRVSIGVTALLTTSVLYQKLAGDLPTVTYITAMDYIFFAFFAFCVAYLLVTVASYETHKSKKHRPSTLLNQGGAAFTVLGLIGTLWFVWIRYWSQA